MRVASINGKKYIPVIVDDYSRFKWVYFLHSKDETPEIIKKFIAQVHLNYDAKFYKIRTDNGTEFKNATLKAHYDKLPEFLWAEAVSTACFTQNRSIIHTRHNKTPYELLHGRKPNVEYFHVFGSLCYPTNDRDDLGKMKPKVDIEAATVEKPASKGRIHKNLLDRVSQLYYSFSLPEYLKADNTVRVNQIVTIFLIESSIHILDHYRYPVNTSLIRIESRKPPTKSLFDVGSSRISIVIMNTKEYHFDVLVVITRIMCRNF
ncbi:retrovirus-related pol polyprotein from transposon TNT 1-94 [Tanacetum coccineum]